MQHLVALTIPYYSVIAFCTASPVGTVFLVNVSHHGTPNPRQDPCGALSEELPNRTNPPACFLAKTPNVLRGVSVKKHLRPGQALKNLSLGGSRHTIKECSWVSGACGATLGPISVVHSILGHKAFLPQNMQSAGPLSPDVTPVAPTTPCGRRL